MKIIEIHIYGYGKLENFKLTNLNEFQVIYGENEAGKSTIMSFIHSILFGFPTKNQAELRYEPKQHSKYGGCLKVKFPQKGTAVIERVKGKALGDVSVLLEDGTTGGEELLQELLLSIDKALFQSIFSFNLHGLQNVQKMKGEDLGKFLFSSGIVGTDRLAAAESTIYKEMETLFKPSGKKPVLNEKIQELRELHIELKKAEKQNERYWEYVEEESQIFYQITILEQQEKVLHRNISKLEELSRLLPLLQEEDQIKTELTNIGDFFFPQNGLSRLESIHEAIKPTNARINALRERIETLKLEVAENKPDKLFLDREGNIVSLAEQVPVIEKLSQEEKVLQVNLSELEEEINLLGERLNVKFSEKELEEIDTSIFMKDKIVELIGIRERLSEKKLELEERYHQEKTELDILKRTERSYQNRFLEEEEKLKLEEQMRAFEQRDQLNKELSYLQDRINTIKFNKERYEEQRKQQKNQTIIQQFIFGSLFVTLLLFGLYSEQYIIALLGGFGIVAVAFLSIKEQKKGKVHDWNDLKDLEKKEQALRKQFSLGSELINVDRMKEQLTKDKQLREEHQELLYRIKKQTEQYGKAIEAIQKWETQQKQNSNMLLHTGKELKLSEHISTRHLKEAFELIEQLKDLYRNKKKANDKLAKNKLEKDAFLRKLNSLTVELLGATVENIQEAVILMRRRLREEQDRKIIYDQKVLKLAEMEEEVTLHTHEKDHLQLEITKLLNMAGAETEEQFRDTAKQAVKRDRLLERLSDIQIQLHIEEQEKREALAIPLNQKILEIELELEQSQYKLAERREALVAIKHKMSVLEEGGLYADLLHHFKQKKYEFIEESKKWTKYAIAKDMLLKTIDRYKHERLPGMLLQASEYLSYLTNNIYITIHLKDEGNSFVIEREDHVLFDVTELSQATAEQVYLAIRLALTTTIYSNYEMPIIIDDSFVNFDHIRTNKVINLLKILQGTHQVLFFTCHKHLLESFEKRNVLELDQYTGVIA